MAINQRDVYFMPFPLERQIEDHPFIVLSTIESNEHENTFVAVMITTSDIHKDDYSFILEDIMFEKALPKKGSHVRMHLITLHSDKNIGRLVTRMKDFYFQKLMVELGNLVFNYKFQKE